MKRSTMLTGVAAALILTASLALAAETVPGPAASQEQAAQWRCPGAQAGGWSAMPQSMQRMMAFMGGRMGWQSQAAPASPAQ